MENGDSREASVEKSDVVFGENPDASSKTEATKDPIAEEFGIDFSGLKKKKKKKVFLMDDLQVPSEAPPPVVQEEDKVEDVTDQFNDLSFSMMKKKKKKKAVNFDDDDFLEMEQEKEMVIENGDMTAPEDSWLNSDRDYTYDELLAHVFNTMKEKDPSFLAGEKKKFIMRPPQVLRIGTKKTSLANFHEICKAVHRMPNHVQAFLLVELGTTGSVDGNNQLIIKGRFQQKQIENVLRRYIKEYVTCHTCHSPNTVLQKDVRLFFLQCETCGSRCSVASIKSGFQAVTGKRAAIRAKTG